MASTEEVRGQQGWLLGPAWPAIRLEITSVIPCRSRKYVMRLEGGTAKRAEWERGTKARGAASLEEKPWTRAQELLPDPLGGKAVDLLLECIWNYYGTIWY